MIRHVDQDLLRVEDLSVIFPGQGGPIHAVRRVGFTVGRERIGIVGESGSGKSTLARAIMGLVPPPGQVQAKHLSFAGLDLLRQTESSLDRIRGRRIGLVLQDPKYALNPTIRVGEQIAETHRRHVGAGRRAGRRAALEMLEAVRILDPERVYRMYPHQVSGGMGQRVMIAMMLVAGPQLLIADEPTSALDATVQAQVLAILDELVRGRGMGLLLISHNLMLVDAFCDRVLVMYGGRVVETCVAGRLADACHPYTRGLLASIPSLDYRQPVLPQLKRDPAWLLADDR